MPFGTAFHSGGQGSGVKTNITTKSAAAQKLAGYSFRNATADIVAAWLDCLAHPESESARNRLATHLYLALKGHLDGIRYSGILQGREVEIAQEACLLLLGRFLAGNKKLISASRAGNDPEIANQIVRSLQAGIKVAKRTLIRAGQRDQRRHKYVNDYDETSPHFSRKHPSEIRTLWELPFEVQKEIVFAALRHGIAAKLVNAQNAEIAVKMVESGLNQADIAKAMKISRQAVHHRLAPVRKYLQARIEQEEFPLK